MEITDDKLLKIALVTSLIGVIGLIIFTPTIEVKRVELSDITRAMIDEEVCVDCVVSEISSNADKTSYFLTLTDGKTKMNMVIFESQAGEMQSRNLDVEMFENRRITAVGKIAEYNGELELILSSGDSLKISSK